MSKLKVLYNLSGSIACYKSCYLISKLVQGGHEVQVVCTKSALKFVGEATLEALSGRAVMSDVFEKERLLDHINLMRWADLTLFCPATANVINKMAAGIGDDLPTSLFLAHDFKKPYYVAPAMNSSMFLHPATSRSLALLKSWGVTVLDTDVGYLACGEQGPGRLLNPDKIYEIITGTNIPQKGRVLITSGGTCEPVDGVRYISNMSTGATGAKLADYLASCGFQVDYLHAEQACLPQNPVQAYRFKTFADLEASLRELLGANRYDCIVHAAAVSDYSVDRLVIDGQILAPSMAVKLSSQKDIAIHLRKNPKLLGFLREWSLNKNIKVVGFKLTNDQNHENRLAHITRLQDEAAPDLVVHNDLNEIDKKAGVHPFTVYAKESTQRCDDVSCLGNYLNQYLSENSFEEGSGL